MKKIYFLAAAAALALTACDNDSSNPTIEPYSTKLRISASIDEAYTTRAEGNSWGAGDHIGIITTVGELAYDSFHPYINLDYYTDNGGVAATFTGPEMLFYNHLTISGYHPYKGPQGSAPGGETDGYLIRTDTRIDKQFEANKAIDFLHGTTSGIKLADANEVKLAFSHQMTKLTFKFESNTTEKNKVDVAKLSKYQIEGLVMDGTFDTLKGDCIADSDKTPENLVTTGLYIPKDKRDESYATRTMKSLIVFPQTPKGDVTLRLFLDEGETGIEADYQVYYCTIRFGDNKLKPGYHYNFTVNVTKAGLQMGTITINDWGEGVNSTIIATIDGDVPFDPNEGN